MPTSPGLGPCSARRSPIAICLLLLGCAAVQPGLGPGPVGSSIDETATSCLDWAWQRSHTREVAGGVVWQGDLLACSELTLGTRNAVRYGVEPHWIVHFHTHTGKGRISPQDMDTVRLDPLARPSYVRHPTGAVVVYECDEGCRQRRVR